MFIYNLTLKISIGNFKMARLNEQQRRQLKKAIELNTRERAKFLGMSQKDVSDILVAQRPITAPDKPLPFVVPQQKDFFERVKKIEDINDTLRGLAQEERNPTPLAEKFTLPTEEVTGGLNPPTLEIATTPPTALDYSNFLVDNSASRTFLQPKKTKLKGKTLEIDFAGRFEPRKYTKKGKRYIEKSKFAIDSLGELQGITAKGLAKLNARRFIRKVSPRKAKVAPKKKRSKSKGKSLGNFFSGGIRL